MIPKHLLPSLLCLSSVAFAHSGGTVIAPYGNSTPGRGGYSPDIWATGHPSPGQTAFALTLDQGVGGAPALLVAGSGPAALPVFGMTLNVDLFKPGFFVAWTGVLSGSSGVGGAGSATAPLPIPGIATLVGIQLHTQFVVLDSGAPQGLAASRGLRVGINKGALAVACGHRHLSSYDYLTKKSVNDGTGSSPDDCQFNVAGTLLLTTGRDGGSSPVLEIYDATVSPLKKLKTVSLGSGAANHLMVHPDDKRAYVTVNDTTAALNYVHIVDIDPTSKTFGTKIGQVKGLATGKRIFEGGSISGSGRVLALAEFAFSGTPNIHIVDVQPGSPNRDTVTKVIPLPGVGSMLTDVDLDEAGINAYVCAASLSQSSTYAQVFIPTGKVTKVVPMGSTALFPTDIDIDPRGRFLVVSCPNSRNLLYLSLTPGTTFMQPRVFTAASKAQPFSVALTPDARTAIAATMSDGIWAWDVATGNIVWSVSPNGGGDAIAVR